MLNITYQEQPYFHMYLQSETLGTAGDAILGSWTTAAQFQVTGGQLIQTPQGTKLYGQVAQFVSGDVKLKVTWSETPGTFGSFVFSGDTLEWSEPTVKRSQNNVSSEFIRDVGLYFTCTYLTCSIGMARLP
jgi:hypothetical protein